LSSKTFNQISQFRTKRGFVDDAGNGLIHLPPHVAERRVDLAPRALLTLLRSLDISQDFSHRDRSRFARQQVAAFRAAPRLHKTALFKPRQNQFQELLRNRLAPGDIADAHRFSRTLRGQVENCL
jgi:hypothetical protein